MNQLFTHVAVTVDPALFEPQAKAELLSAYSDIFGWHENEAFAKPGERILLRAPTDSQYLTIRAADAPMQTSGYEHLGVWLESEDEVRATHERASKLSFPDVELGEVRSLYGGSLLTFRFRFRLPLTIEVQHFPLNP